MTTKKPPPASCGLLYVPNGIDGWQTQRLWQIALAYEAGDNILAAVPDTNHEEIAEAPRWNEERKVRYALYDAEDDRTTGGTTDDLGANGRRNGVPTHAPRSPSFPLHSHLPLLSFCPRRQRRGDEHWRTPLIEVCSPMFAYTVGQMFAAVTDVRQCSLARRL
jgi:hypothetical protein